MNLAMLSLKMLALSLVLQRCLAKSSSSLRGRELKTIGKYNTATDHLEVHFDMLWDIDDVHCVGALRMLFDYYEIDATVVTGTHTQNNGGGWSPYGNEVGTLNMAFPLGQCNGNVPGDCAGPTNQKGWVNADEDWNHNPNSNLVSEIGGLWMKTLESGGKVWIMEGGMGDFTLDVARWVQSQNGNLDLKNIHSVQHSQWNIDNSGSGVYNALPALISHHKISDGNGSLNSNIGGDKNSFVNRAASGIYASLWEQIWKGDGGWQKKIDFSDTVELLWILEQRDFVEDYDNSEKPWESFMEIYNRSTPGPPPAPVAPVAAPTPPVTSQESSAFREQDGYIIMEAESVVSSEPNSQWIFETSVRDYFGDGYYRMNAYESSKIGDPISRMSYFLRVSNPGTYRMLIRAWKNGDASDQNNDCWVKMVGAQGAQGRDTKVYLSGPMGEWNWYTTLETFDHQHIAADYTFDSAGVYELQVSGRSYGYHMDRIVFFHLDMHDEEDVRGRSESPRDGNPPVPPAPVASPPAASPVASPPTGSPPFSCGMPNFSNECTSTGGCQEKYDGATDCDNQGGGVCMCDDAICGCRDLGVGSTELTCFSGSNTVEVQDSRGVIGLADLSIGDFVRTANGKFSRVYSFSHIERDAQANYLQIFAEGLNQPLEISRNHMVYVGETPVRAKDVKIGDMMGKSKVVAIEAVLRQGIYAPVSTSGDIMVSGVLASCFVALLDIPAPIQHAAAQAVHSPLRLACAADFEICQSETYTAGRSNFVWNIIQVVRAAQHFLPIALQLVATLVVSPFIVALQVIEQAFLGPLLSTAMMGLLAFVAYRRTKKSESKEV